MPLDVGNYLFHAVCVPVIEEMRVNSVEDGKRRAAFDAGWAVTDDCAIRHIDASALVRLIDCPTVPKAHSPTTEPGE